MDDLLGMTLILIGEKCQWISIFLDFFKFTISIHVYINIIFDNKRQLFVHK